MTPRTRYALVAIPGCLAIVLSAMNHPLLMDRLIVS